MAFVLGADKSARGKKKEIVYVHLLFVAITRVTKIDKDCCHQVSNKTRKIGTTKDPTSRECHTQIKKRKEPYLLGG
jgi:hypothetical protein